MKDNSPMSEAMYYILLAFTNPTHGYELMKRVTEISKSRVTMGPGTLYGVLKRLEKDKLIEFHSYEGRRKVYALTLDGKEVLQNEFNRLKALVLDGEMVGGMF